MNEFGKGFGGEEKRKKKITRYKIMTTKEYQNIKLGQIVKYPHRNKEISLALIIGKNKISETIEVKWITKTKNISKLDYLHYGCLDIIPINEKETNL